MKKAVPLSLLLASSQVFAAPDYFKNSQWAIASTAAVAGNPQVSSGTCCYFSGPVTVSSADSLTGSVGNAAFVTAASANTNACYQYINTPNAATTISASGTWTQTVVPDGTGLLGAVNSGAAGTTGTVANKGGKTNFYTVSNSGQTLTMQVDPEAGNNAVCGNQVFTRTNQAVSGAVGTWTVAAGTGSGCCFLDTATELVVATVGTTTTATGKYATDTTNCVAGNFASSGAAYSQVLQPAPAGASYTASDIRNFDTFTVSGNTVTYRPGNSQSCSQVLTKVSSSAINVAMLPAVVGAAAMGVFVV